MEGPLERYRADLRSVVGSNATAYVYTLTLGSAGAVLFYAYRPPSPPLVSSFIGGAVLAFAVAGIFTSGGVTVEFTSAPNRVQL